MASLTAPTPTPSPESTFKKTWRTWDKAWELNLTDSKRLSHLQSCLTYPFTYTNPMIEIKIKSEEDLDVLIRYIVRTLEDTGNKLLVKHRDWMENHQRSALHWDLDDMTTSQAALHGWSYGQYDDEGRLMTVADFW